MLSDDELVEQIKSGDEQAAEELIKRYYTSILRYCKWHCASKEKAEDLVLCQDLAQNKMRSSTS